MKLTYENEYGEVLDLSRGNIRAVKADGLCLKSELKTVESADLIGSAYVTGHIGCRRISLLLYAFGSYEKLSPVIFSAFRVLKNGVLTVLYDDGKVRKTTCITESIDYPLIKGCGKAVVTLLCPSPYFEDTKWEDVQLCGENELIEFDGFELPEEDILELSSINDRYSAALINHGDTDIGCIITVSASRRAGGIKIINPDTKQQLAINYPVYAGAVLVFDTRSGHKSITIRNSSSVDGDAADITPYIKWGSEFIRLSPGRNRLYISAEYGLDGLSASVSYSQLFEGV